MSTEISAIEKFREVVSNRHQYAQDWKARKGGKVIGWFCSYSPVEIVYAAGMLPVRVLGGLKPERLSDEYMFGKCCPYCRDILAQGLKGLYNYLDGIVHARSCDAIELTFHNWSRHLPIGFSHFILMPGHVDSPRALNLLTQEYVDFSEKLGKYGGRPISEEDLRRAIKLYNTNRELMRKVYEFGKMDAPPITGKEALEVSLAGQLMDVEEHTELLRQLLKELPNRKLERDVGVRLMLSGSVNDNLDFVDLIEGLGATCVIDENCCSTKFFWDDVKDQGNPLEAIAYRYIHRWPCPAFDWKETGENRERWKRIWNLAQEYRIQGAILYVQKFCGPHGYDTPVMKSFLEKHDIPTLVLELDVTIPLGQFRTRIEAFIETLTLELV